MKKRILSLLLCAALTLACCLPALAAQEEPEGEETEQGESVPEETTPEESVPEDPEGTVSFENLAARVRENELNARILEENIAAVEVTDYEQLREDLKDQINTMTELRWQLRGISSSLPSTENPSQDFVNQTLASLLGSSASQSMDQAYQTLRDTYDDLKSGQLQQDARDAVRQLRNAQDQIVMMGEAAYVAIQQLEVTRTSLERSLEAADRSLEELELRYKLGQISALTLHQAAAGRTSLESSLSTVDYNLTCLKLQLEQMLGVEATGTIQLQALPDAPQAQAEEMDLERDLAAAKEKSYALFAAEKTLEQAREDFKDAERTYHYDEEDYQYIAARHTWQAAQYTYQATVQNFETSFRLLYLQVGDYEQALQAAQAALDYQQESYAAQQLKYEQGSISQNALLTARDDLMAARDAVDTARLNLFSARNNYRWAVKYGILNG